MSNAGRRRNRSSCRSNKSATTSRRISRSSWCPAGRGGHELSNMSGSLAVVGIGPGNPDMLTPEASDALQAADTLYGYGPYLDRVPPRAGQTRHVSDNREEGARAAAALR